MMKNFTVLFYKSKISILFIIKINKYKQDK